MIESKKDIISTLDYFARLDQDIISLVTAEGGPVAIIRISGSNLSEKYKDLFKTDITNKYREAIFTEVKGFDHALVLSFKAPRSFTGDDVIEVQCHGVKETCKKIIQKFLDKGALKALPGEFSFRAYKNEKMSLQQLEMLNLALGSEKINSHHAQSLLGYSNEAEKSLNQNLENLSSYVVAARGRLESAINFPEAEEEQKDDVKGVLDFLDKTILALNNFQNSFENFALQNQNPVAVLVGETNVGKSTLFNILSSGENAIVSKTAGTTRDALRFDIQLEKSKLSLFDTAGIRESSDTNDHDLIEAQGMSVAFDKIKKSDIVISVKKSGAEATDGDLDQVLSGLKKPVIEVFSHNDLSDSNKENSFDFRSDSSEVFAFVSQKIQELVDRKKDSVDFDHLVSQRQMQLLEEVRSYCLETKKVVLDDIVLEVAADLLQKAESSLKRCIGKGLDEEHIGAIFSQFCLGK